MYKRQTLSDARVEQGEMQLQVQQERPPQAESAHASARIIVDGHRADMVQAEQRLQLEQSNRGHAQRSLQILSLIHI